MKYQLVIFDSDGTLADTLPWMRTVFNELALTHGFKQVDPEDHKRMRDLHEWSCSGHWNCRFGKYRES
jgi:phosphoglycolate phosphatase